MDRHLKPTNSHWKLTRWSPNCAALAVEKGQQWQRACNDDEIRELSDISEREGGAAHVNEAESKDGEQYGHTEVENTFPGEVK